MTIFTVLLIAIAAFLWIGLVATVATINGNDAAANGLSEYYAVFGSIGLWLLLAVIMIIAGIRGGMSVRSAICAVVLLPASCAATIAAIAILKDATESRWPIVVPVLAPMLLLSYAVWLYFPRVRALVAAQTVEAVTWGVLLLLSVAPWPRTIHNMHTTESAAELGTDDLTSERNDAGETGS
jgi:hypothetical protein